MSDNSYNEALENLALDDEINEFIKGVAKPIDPKDVKEITNRLDA